MDFGSATFSRGGKMLSGFEGTKFFAAPEVYLSRPYGAKSDVWSVGVCLMVLLTGGVYAGQPSTKSSARVHQRTAS